jgi:hypothetical protein
MCTIDPTLRADATKANSLVERKNARTPLDAESRILLLLVHWTARFFKIADPEVFEPLYREPDLSQEIREEWQRDAIAATKVIAVQLQEPAQHALLVNRHHAAEAKQRTRKQLKRELQLPTSVQELIRCTKSESSRLIFGTAVAEEVDRQRELERRRKKDKERSAIARGLTGKAKGRSYGATFSCGSSRPQQQSADCLPGNRQHQDGKRHPRWNLYNRWSRNSSEGPSSATN